MRKRELIALLVGLGISTQLAAQKPQYGSFYYVADKDEMDDSNRSYVYTVSLNITPTRGASVGWKCFSDGLNVILLLGKYYGGDSDDQIRVQYRFDTDPASDVENWSLLTGKKAAYMPMDEVSTFTERAKHAAKVVIRTTDPLDGESHTDEFSLRGATEALARLTPCSPNG